MFKVERAEAENFSKVWTTKYGLLVPLSSEAVQFATDFSNVVLNNFITMCQQEAQKKIQEQQKKAIIVEGI